MLFFPFFESVPTGADHVSPLREQFIATCHLQPASNLSFTTPFLIMESHSKLEWQDLQRQLLGSANIWRTAKCEVGCYILLLPYWKQQLWSSHVRQSKTKADRAQHRAAAQQQAFKGISPHNVSIPASERLSSPQHGGEERSLRALFTWPNTAQDGQFNPDSFSIPLLVITQGLVKFQQPVSTPGKKSSVYLWEASTLGFSGLSVSICAKLAKGEGGPCIGKSRYV